MGYYFIKCRSVTYAQRASKLLKSRGISAGIIKLPIKYSEEGCGYSLRVSEKQFNKAYELLTNSGFDVKRIYKSKDGIDFQEVGE